MKSTAELIASFTSLFDSGAKITNDSIITALTDIVNSMNNKLEPEVVTDVEDTFADIESPSAGKSYIVKADNLVYYYSSDSAYETVDYPVGKVLQVENLEYSLYERVTAGWQVIVNNVIT